MFLYSLLIDHDGVSKLENDGYLILRSHTLPHCKATFTIGTQGYWYCILVATVLDQYGCYESHLSVVQSVHTSCSGTAERNPRKLTRKTPNTNSQIRTTRNMHCLQEWMYCTGSSPLLRCDYQYDIYEEAILFKNDGHKVRARETQIKAATTLSGEQATQLANFIDMRNTCKLQLSEC